MVLLLIALVALAFPASARGDGLPILGIDAGLRGVSMTGGSHRYVTLVSSAGTDVAAIDRNGGRVSRWVWTPGQFTIPAVALDGTPDGLSHDGETLVLIRPRARFPQSSTRFAIFKLRPLRGRGRRLRLRGDYSFDALSPDGRTLFLIHYRSRRDYTRYEVRSLDLATGALHPDPIVDPREPGEEMRGLPLTRLVSPDGRWHYTLYDGNGEHPFVHALDTVDRTAACIDLDVLGGRTDLGSLRLDLNTTTLRVLAGDRTPVALIDTQTFAARVPAAWTGLPALALAT